MNAHSYTAECPFCGSLKAQEAAVPNTNGNRRFIRCLGCGAEGPWNKGELDAVRRWNTRHSGPADELVRRRLAAVVRWLEENQPDVFRRGLWDAVNESDATGNGS
jgi:Lar family restriction alleviation protein